ncbi:YkuS family protein [Serpentinicella sp. ANB-PHB4]|uniref:YkuS family protein n=1 Tax=Serpentinicella sp. ANB-PHB4 TaxID=3074076 RepID=UPI00285E4E42|nr:YkuS family protein [Serpentinicella sp. ANB-PHB4]MDR5658896.1 YkuS family protein [Serpentinicella sp. ANB-PHB4]
MKRVVVQNNLDSIRDALSQKGYEVVDFNDTGFVDAVIYIDDQQGIKSVNSSEKLNNQGCIIINAKNRSIEDIEYIIETRRYERLF